MVLWEITLATAYFLGLKRTYRLAIKIQRKIVRPKYPKIRQFLHRRTRAIFDVAISVHRNIQERDVEVGRNVGNFILRWLDRIKPSAQIRGPLSGSPVGSSGEKITKNATATSNNSKPPGYSRFFKKDSDRHLFTASLPKPFPTISMIVKQPNSAWTTIHGRRLGSYAPEAFRSNYRGNWSEGVIRKDIMQFMLGN
ncbi:hypothetical protein TanjilG_28671 [Lupinus angustifolius]|uniref:Uncharacterized protein n=1 Tax=Lupinus angustifolius TaxID=3871 RepID=A0A1J7FM95_LUPAN|nr:PREDICTED: uncharacterized protein LOC109341820 [Lupinus angustifolius]OIV89069.1 hypothetical protein TanjilG_28671 [Lupinus angustifolius]